jgi:small subunit ribosomal protein S3
MIERDFIAQKTKEYYIQRYVESKLARSGISSIKLKKIPLGEKIIINTARPSLIVGSKGSNIRELTKELKREFNLENPQIEINEVKDVFLDPAIVAEKIATSMERFGSARFKGIGHKIMENVMKSGALGIEIVISGKIPSSRAKSWRFYQGYLKKSGDASLEGVRRFSTSALLKSGVVGIKVSIMPPDLKLPDRIELKDELVDQEVSKISKNNKEVEDKIKKKKSSAIKSLSTKSKSSLSKPVKKSKKVADNNEMSEDRLKEKSEEKKGLYPEDSFSDNVSDNVETNPEIKTFEDNP